MNFFFLKKEKSFVLFGAHFYKTFCAVGFLDKFWEDINIFDQSSHNYQLIITKP